MCPQEALWLCLCVFLFLEVRCWQIGSDSVTLTKGEERRRDQKRAARSSRKVFCDSTFQPAA